jgi:hypothetical protein
VALQAPAADPLQGFIPEPEFLERMESAPVAPLGFPSRVLHLLALAHGSLPGPSSYTLHAQKPEGLSAQRPRVLRNEKTSESFPTANPYGFFDLTVT